MDLNIVEKVHIYNGQGTHEDPFVVEFWKDDPENPMNWSSARKWFLTAIVTWSVFVVTFTSSAYSESSNEVIGEFNISNEVFIVGVSIFVLGFAVGPAVWGPLVSTQSSLSYHSFESELTIICCIVSLNIDYLGTLNTVLSLTAIPTQDLNFMDDEFSGLYLTSRW